MSLFLSDICIMIPIADYNYTIDFRISCHYFTYIAYCEHIHICDVYF